MAESKRMKKACKTAVYGKGRRETRGEWLIGAHTQNIATLLSVVTTQRKTRQRCVICLLMRVKARRRVSVMNKA